MSRLLCSCGRGDGKAIFTWRRLRLLSSPLCPATLVPPMPVPTVLLQLCLDLFIGVPSIQRFEHRPIEKDTLSGRKLVERRETYVRQASWPFHLEERTPRLLEAPRFTVAVVGVVAAVLGVEHVEGEVLEVVKALFSGDERLEDLAGHVDLVAEIKMAEVREVAEGGEEGSVVEVVEIAGDAEGRQARTAREERGDGAAGSLDGAGVGSSDLRGKASRGLLVVLSLRFIVHLQLASVDVDENAQRRKARGLGQKGEKGQRRCRVNEGVEVKTFEVDGAREEGLRMFDVQVVCLAVVFRHESAVVTALEGEESFANAAAGSLRPIDLVEDLVEELAGKLGEAVESRPLRLRVAE